MKPIFKRNIEADLVAWAVAENQKPLILKGARQVGKTYLMKWLGSTQFNQCAYFNFEEKPELSQFFENTKDVRRIIDNLSIVNGQQITNKTLLIFDEIQECLPALNALKYFYENILSNFPKNKKINTVSYFIKNRVFIKFIKLKFTHHLFLKFKKLPKEMIDRY